MIRSLLCPIALLLIYSCSPLIEKGVRKSDLSKDVEMVTDHGTIIMRLSDETPKHRNNFIRLVKRKFYDSLAFHRVINNFVIQTGDPETKPSFVRDTTKKTSPSFTIPAEFTSDLFHKRGALNAARTGDDTNPERASSSTQFTVVQGKIYTDSLLTIAEKRINGWLAYNKVINDPANKELFAQLQRLMKRKTNIDSLTVISARLQEMAKTVLANSTPYKIPESHRQVYKTIGGAAHLDQNYTVFGEVVKGMDVVDSIAHVKTNERDKPITDVRIISAKMIPRKQYN